MIVASCDARGPYSPAVNPAKPADAGRGGGDLTRAPVSSARIDKGSITITGFTAVAFLAAFSALRHLDPEGILFYQGIGLGALLTLLQLILSRYALREPLFLAAKDALLSFLLIYSFLITVPTTVDRSYSVRMIEQLAAAHSGLTHDEISQLFVSDFIQQGGVTRRLHEQQVTGTLREHDGRYYLTLKGRILAYLFRGTDALFDCGR